MFIKLLITLVMLVVSVFCCSPSYSMTIDPQWQVKSQSMLLEAPTNVQQQVFVAEQYNITGSYDVVYNFAQEQNEILVFLRDDPQKPGYGVGTCVNNVDLVKRLAAEHSYTLETVLDLGICGHYTIDF